MRDLLQQFDKGVKAVKMYLPNNPQYRLFVSRTVQRFRDFFALWPEVRLEVGRWELTSGGETVYRNEDRGNSLAFVLHKDGIRELSVRAGVEEWEVGALLEAFNRDFTREYLEDDLVTVFWEQNFRHIAYQASEEVVEEFLPPEVAGATDRGRALMARAGLPDPGDGIKDIIAPGPAGSPGSGIPLIQTHLRHDLFDLSGEERDRLARLAREDASQSFFPQLVETVFNILSLESDPSSVTDLLDLLRKLLDLELKKTDFGMAESFLRRLAKIPEMGGGLDSRTVRRCEDFLDYLETAEFIGGPLAQALVRAPDSAAEEVASFLASLPIGAAPGLLELFDRVESMKMRKALCRGLATLIRNDPAAIEAGLDDSRWFVARNSVTVLGMVGSAATALYLRKVMRHPDVRVRREVLKAALEMAPDDAEDFLSAALEDEDDKQRLLGIKSVTRRFGDAVRRRLLAVAAGPAFRRRGDEERRQVYLALARLGGSEALSLLEDLLGRRAWFGKELQREQRWAVEALVASGSEEARALLGRASRSGPGAVREACRKAVLARPSEGEGEK